MNSNKTIIGEINSNKCERSLISACNGYNAVLLSFWLISGIDRGPGPGQNRPNYRGSDRGFARWSTLFKMQNIFKNYQNKSLILIRNHQFCCLQFTSD